MSNREVALVMILVMVFFLFFTLYLINIDLQENLRTQSYRCQVWTADLVCIDPTIDVEFRTLVPWLHGATPTPAPTLDTKDLPNG